MKDIPVSVGSTEARELYAACQESRTRIKAVASTLDRVRVASREAEAERLAHAEVAANVELAYRHLEDASMRLGKALQALDGGVSVYDRETTVGA